MTQVLTHRGGESLASLDTAGSFRRPSSKQVHKLSIDI